MNPHKTFRSKLLSTPMCFAQGIISYSVWLLDSSTNSSNFATLVFRESHYGVQISLHFACEIWVSLKLGTH